MQIHMLVRLRGWCVPIAMATAMGLVVSLVQAQGQSANDPTNDSAEASHGLPGDAPLRANPVADSLTPPATVQAEIDEARFPVLPDTADPKAVHVLMIIGLPGTPSHAALHQQLARTWYVWFQNTLGIPAENILVCNRAASESTSKLPLYSNDRAGIQEAIRQLAARADPQGATWIMMLGHGSYDGRDAHLHLPGPDLSARDYAALLADLPGAKQIVCCTMSCSGHFLEHLSRPGRFVITATTADAEPNETEFPEALAAVMRRSSGIRAAELDRDGDHYLSLLELLAATSSEVAKRYAADSRAETEHALLDDDGDGRGSQMDSWAKLLTPPPAIDSENAAPAGSLNTDSGVPGNSSVAQPTEPVSDGVFAGQWRLLRIAAADPAAATTRDPTADDTDPNDSRDGS